MENANDNGVENAMKTKPLYEIEADLDRLQNAKAPIRYSPARLGEETGDITLTGEPPEEPLTDPVGCFEDAMAAATTEVDNLRRFWSTNTHDRLTKALAMIRRSVYHMRAARRAASTKMRNESNAAPEKPLVDPIDGLVGAIEQFGIASDNPIEQPDGVRKYAKSKLGVGTMLELVRQKLRTQEKAIEVMSDTIRLMEQRLKSKACSAECQRGEPWPTPQADPQSEAQAAGLAAIDRAIPETETPTDAA